MGSPLVLRKTDKVMRESMEGTRIQSEISEVECCSLHWPYSMDH